MSIVFTMYIPPNGRAKQVTIDRTPETEAMAEDVIKDGGKFTIEKLSTGRFSITCEAFDQSIGETCDIAIEICANELCIELAVDKVVHTAYMRLCMQRAEIE